MATANEIDEIRSTLQRGLENLALSGNLKPLPLRQQAERPLLRSPVKVNGYCELALGKPAFSNHSISSDSGGHPSPASSGHLQNGRRPASAKGKPSRTLKSPRDISRTQIHSKSQIHSKPPTGRPRNSRPTSSRSRSTASLSQKASNRNTCQNLQRAASQNLSRSVQSVNNSKIFLGKGDPKQPGAGIPPKQRQSQKNGFLIPDSDDESEEWCDVEEENEDSEFNPLEK